MNVPFTGGCACGAVRYECTAEPFMALNCHCRDCQRASGSAYASGVFVSAGAFRFIKGAPRYYASVSDRGTDVTRGFCAECGSPLVAGQAAQPFVIIHAANLDEPGQHRPTMDVFASSAQPWDHMDPALPKYARRIGE